MDDSEATALVRRAYDRLGARFSTARSQTHGLDFVARAVCGLPAGAHVLDVGCGPGTPIARYLLDRGLSVTGVDVSEQQLRIAAQRVPEATLHRSDICEFEAEAGSYDAIVAWDSVFHVPRARHGALFDAFARWLRPGGLLVLTGGGSAGEFTDTMLGETFFYSGYAPDQTAKQLGAAGLGLLEQVVDDASSRGYAVFIAQRPATSP